MPGPDWKEKADAFEAAGDMRGAEKAVLDAVQHLGAYASVAELWGRQIKRRLSTGDAAGAVAAYHRACYWAFCYASSATSGGEGMALSRERDSMAKSYLSALGHDPGPDPGFKHAQAALPPDA